MVSGFPVQAMMRKDATMIACYDNNRAVQILDGGFLQ